MPKTNSSQISINYSYKIRNELSWQQYRANLVFADQLIFNLRIISSTKYNLDFMHDFDRVTHINVWQPITRWSCLRHVRYTCTWWYVGFKQQEAILHGQSREDLGYAHFLALFFGMKSILILFWNQFLSCISIRILWIYYYNKFYNKINFSNESD